MNKRLTTAAIALALGLAWTAAPAMAQSTTEKIKDKAETAKDKIEEKATDIKDKVKDKTVDLKDKVTSKMHRTSKAENPDVTAMQRALMDKGFDPGPIDGRMGKRTRAALRDYQKKEGLNATGRWDEETGNRLGVRMSRMTPGDTMHSSTPSASPSTPSAAPGTSQAPPAVPEDKTASPAKRNSP
jgi:peptidoglycan hydrolase-like protein with peptidoglycan-binding domain